MRLIIAGSRSIGIGLSLCEINAGLEKMGWSPSVVISGCAAGVDTAAIIWARAHRVTCERYPVTSREWKAWQERNRRQPNPGHARNERMADVADALLAIWNGKSPGTANMIECMRARKLPHHVRNLTQLALPLENR